MLSTLGENYKVTHTENKDNYNYFINVCAETGIQCPMEAQTHNHPACQTSMSNSDFARRMGSTDHMELR